MAGGKTITKKGSGDKKRGRGRLKNLLRRKLFFLIFGAADFRKKVQSVNSSRNKKKTNFELQERSSYNAEKKRPGKGKVWGKGRPPPSQKFLSL